jgi:hypothetical protein
MCVRRTLSAVAAIFMLAAQLPAQGELPPVSYVCPMDADIVETGPGRCPTCKMDLEPVRLDLAWSCPNHSAVIAGKAGFCPIDRRELVQVTVAKFWTCPESGKRHLLEPGSCGNNGPRKLEQLIRAHGDHNPRHGGQFFMAADKWHHLEGTYPRAGLFRVHFYDNFTKVFPAKGFNGRLVTKEEGNREIDAVPLRVSRDGLTMEANIKGIAEPTKATPLRLTAKLVLKPGEPEQRFDFTFTDLSKEPAVAPQPAAALAPAAKNRPAPAAAAAPQAASLQPVPAAPAPLPTGVLYPTPESATSAAASPPAAVAAPAPAEPATAAAGGEAMANCSPTMSRNDAVALGQRLPKASADLLRLLSMCSAEVDTLIKDGQFGFVYQPSILSKDIAIALESTLAELPGRQRAHAAKAIRRVVLAAWTLDLYGDQGNREKLADSFTTFAAAVADIKSAYASKP